MNMERDRGPRLVVVYSVLLGHKSSKLGNKKAALPKGYAALRSIVIFPDEFGVCLVVKLAERNFSCQQFSKPRRISYCGRKTKLDYLQAAK